MTKFTPEPQYIIYDPSQISEIQTEIKTRSDRSFLNGYLLGFSVCFVVILAIHGYLSLTHQPKGEMPTYYSSPVPTKIVP